MQVMLLIYEDESVYGEDKGGELLRQMVERHMAFAGSLGAARVGGAGLAGSATAVTLRGRDGARSVLDGPFAEAREQLGGYYLIDVPDIAAAIAIAQRVPLSSERAGVEIRPLLRGE